MRGFLLRLTQSNAMLGHMKNTLLKNLLIPALLYTFTASAGLYKGLDEEGNVIYSDKPFENSQQFTPPAITVIDAAKGRQNC